MKNYLRLEKTFTGRKYVFVDTVDHFYKQVFPSCGIKIRKCREYIREGSALRLVICKVLRRDIDQFEVVINEVRNKALLLGYREYDEACEMLIKMERGEISG